MPALTKTRIIDAAVELIDERGLDVLTMRSLAERLDVTATALYYHVDGRDDLLNGIVERYSAKIATEAARDGDWREQLRTLVLAIVNELTLHPNLALWIITVQARQPSVLDVHEAMLDVLVRAGFGPLEAISIKGTIFRHLIGHLVLANAPEGPPWKQLPKRYRNMRSVGPTFDVVDRQVLFAFGLDAILAGLPSPPKA